MTELIELKEIEERVILVAVSTGDEEDAKGSLDELEELVKTAGAVAVDKVIQNRERIHPGTYLGKGKIEEIKDRIWELDATGIVCDDELSPAQLRNLEGALDTKVMDRTMVILDIFASRAVTREGKIQVELAQLRYRSARLVGLRSSLSRLGGGIGTRGPGEKKLEMDRRLIHDRIGMLKAELEDVKRHREVVRQQRDKNHVPAAAIVGYTNAGKSTLLNRLTDAGILAEDKLFATLDPTTRNLSLPGGQQILLTDTVGFIRKLPHHLIEAFKSTLEEAKYSDIILHVVDCSNPQMDMQMYVVYETLRELGICDKIMITVFNKIDAADAGVILRDVSSDHQVRISAKTGEGLDELINLLETILRNQKVYLERIYSYKEAGKIQLIRKYGQLLKEEYQEDGIFVNAYVPSELFASLADNADAFNE
ncbi:GTPase HflX [Lacrimispora saccharolytica]|uniref:GTPase HflX n=1 Tax=Lacrimispora saccharolytica (strain ATCC 35040 / DSM 2544 / NRCC 2533 / WM1) TaxID=610130 RepID=HFLX_LACSW|nr:GTPase HflX [Lacrimispora saccharolytica]D9R4W7.1 RecName: Full=GTPase HflX; AltName: Full=GTP-binding protein HflX [[Clostridium] saccharolyticum WM1]ADL05074.1 GTP-binding proten HflX [[Clostridium] saccharolyticum WM1]QRV20735.1 GTPase HflX [Lacrimispora saccharolytica]